MSESIPKKIQRIKNGIVLLDKPQGISSNDALQKIKRLYAVKKAGHTGSLDPLATGMLPILFGEATKFSQFLLEADKTYRVVARLGIKTTTGDAEGEIIQRQEVPPFKLHHIQTVLKQFCGDIKQTPPMYSAVKHQGQPLYKLARQGIEIERAARDVSIFKIDLLAQGDETLTLDIHCSKGTYIRVLIQEIGDALGCGATVEVLRRSSVSFYQSDEMQTLPDLAALFDKEGFEGIDKKILPLNSLLRDLPAITLTPLMVGYVRQGQAVFIPHLPQANLVQLLLPSGEFLGVGEIASDGRVAPKRLVSQVSLVTADQ